MYLTCHSYSINVKKKLFYIGTYRFSIRNTKIYILKVSKSTLEPDDAICPMAGNLCWYVSRQIWTIFPLSLSPVRIMYSDGENIIFPRIMDLLLSTKKTLIGIIRYLQNCRSETAMARLSHGPCELGMLAYFMKFETFLSYFSILTFKFKYG